MKQLIDNIKLGVVILLIVGGVLAVPYLEFKAYRARFPDAPSWTFFFQGGRR